MAEATPLRDQWTEWLLEHRFGGADPERRRTILAELERVRDRVLEHAAVREGDVLLDVGAGDGLIAFGALPLVGSSGRVIFSDISQDLLDHAAALARQMGVADRVEFLRSAAEDLSAVGDASVDVVTTRSVLIYVAEKGAAFREFHRVLRPVGRVSIFEPINRFGFAGERSDRFMGYSVGPVREIAGKLAALYERYQFDGQPAERDPMGGFDERDLLRHAEEAGFADIHLDYQAWIVPRRPMQWEYVLKSAGNPKIPTLEQAMREALSEAEAEEFTAYLRPLVETGAASPEREAVAYLWARKR